MTLYCFGCVGAMAWISAYFLSIHFVYPSTNLGMVLRLLLMI